jgi:hypothetical protein
LRRKLDANEMIKPAQLFAALIGVVVATPDLTSAKELNYRCSVPPLEVTFTIVGGYYSGSVNCGNLFLQSDIPAARSCGGSRQCEKTLR